MARTSTDSGSGANWKTTTSFPCSSPPIWRTAGCFPLDMCCLHSAESQTKRQTSKHSSKENMAIPSRHSKQLDNRGSSIYTKRARYSIFGVGNYSFSPAKVAISGLYKNLQFQAVGSTGGKPIMVDDTCYFIPCDSKSEAEFFTTLLNSERPAIHIISCLHGRKEARHYRCPQAN